MLRRSNNRPERAEQVRAHFASRRLYSGICSLGQRLFCAPASILAEVLVVEHRGRIAGAKNDEIRSQL